MCAELNVSIYRGAHGSRLLLSVHKNDDPFKSWTHAYFDFADARDDVFLAARRDGTAPVSPASDAKMRTQFSRDLSGGQGIFKEPVQTILPYHSIETDWEQLPDDVDDHELLLSDNHIVKASHFTVRRLHIQALFAY